MPKSSKGFKEEWKQIKGYEGLYEISNLGRIISLTRGRKLRKFSIWAKGYYCVMLSKKSIVKNFLVHRLIMIAFVPNPQNKREVNHKNGDKLDNNLNNLEWVTPSENIKHAYDTGLMQFRNGISIYRSKLNEFQVRRIRLLKEITPSTANIKISKMFKICTDTVSRIVNRKHWNHI